MRRRVMPAVVVGVDLAESSDVWTRRTGLDLLAAALDARSARQIGAAGS